MGEELKLKEEEVQKRRVMELGEEVAGIGALPWMARQPWVALEVVHARRW